MVSGGLGSKVAVGVVVLGRRAREGRGGRFREVVALREVLVHGCIGAAGEWGAGGAGGGAGEETGGVHCGGGGGEG